MILQNKNAVIYGGGGSIGAALATAFAKAGARVFLTSRRIDEIQKTMDEIIASGGVAEVAIVDAMDENSINQHLEEVIQKADSIDISFNVIGLEVVQGMSMIEMNVEDFARPATIAMRSHFLTATAAARAMIKNQSGVILSLTATPGGIGYPFTAGFAPACAALEKFYSNLAGEIGIYGIRTVNIRSAGSPDSAVFKEAIEKMPLTMKAVIHEMENDTMLKKLPLMEDIANTAVFLASDQARMITGVTVDVTAGTTSGLNYRAK